MRPRKLSDSRYDTVGAWAKRCYFAGRAAMEVSLRPFGLGASQWYVLHQLSRNGPTMQRDLLRLLQVERATLSGILGLLVRKGLVEQVTDKVDHRQKRLQLTTAGAALWEQLPDLAFIHEAAFGNLDAAEVAVAVKVLRIATERLEELLRKGTET